MEDQPYKRRLDAASNFLGVLLALCPEWGKYSVNQHADGVKALLDKINRTPLVGNELLDCIVQLVLMGVDIPHRHATKHKVLVLFTRYKHFINGDRASDDPAVNLPLDQLVETKSAIGPYPLYALLFVSFQVLDTSPQRELVYAQWLNETYRSRTTLSYEWIEGHFLHYLASEAMQEWGALFRIVLHTVECFGHKESPFADVLVHIVKGFIGHSPLGCIGGHELDDFGRRMVKFARKAVLRPPY